jgi:hypothetical protein
MTISQIITKVNDLEPNQYSTNQKMAWLTQLDGQIFDELILTHEHEDGITFTAYSAETDELLVPFPYGEDVYVNYLKARIAEANHEVVKYNGSMTLFNTAYQNYSFYYNRNVMPLPRSTRFYF